MTRFYDIDEANACLDEVRPVLEGLPSDRNEVARLQRELSGRRTNGSGEHADEMRARKAELRSIVKRMERSVARIDAWDITLRDIETGLIDFPALANGRQIWLCWRLGEESIGWWHELNAGFSSRKQLAELS